MFVSSSSVYSQNDDSWVDERSPTTPARFSGQMVLEGEQTALNSGHPATAIRSVGFTGPRASSFWKRSSTAVWTRLPRPRSAIGSTKPMPWRWSVISSTGHWKENPWIRVISPVIANRSGWTKWWHGYVSKCRVRRPSQTPAKVAAQAASAAVTGVCWRPDSNFAIRISGRVTRK